MKFYKRDPDRALAGMIELSLRQRGAYNSLLDLLYSRDGDVDDDDVRIARMISCHWREWKNIKQELIGLGKVWSEGGKIRAKRVQETIKEASEFGQEQSKRVSQRWHKSEKDNENNDASIPRGNTNTPTPTATPIERKKERESRARGDFDSFWQACPRKVGKRDAKAAYDRACDRAWPETILAGIARYAASRAGEEERYTAHPASWLNADRWLDETGPAKAPMRPARPSRDREALDASRAGMLAALEERDGRSNQPEQAGALGQARTPLLQAPDDRGRTKAALG